MKTIMALIVALPFIGATLLTLKNIGGCTPYKEKDYAPPAKHQTSDNQYDEWDTDDE